MLQLHCPHCGVRDETEFVFGGQPVERPDPATADDAMWSDYLFVRPTGKDIRSEWWHHHGGCGRWFRVERNIVTQALSLAAGEQP